MKTNFVIFFSWQSEIPSNKALIKKEISRVCKSMPEHNISLDESTSNMPGSPNIPDAIFKKINQCDIFLCDVTPIAENNGKLIPNPNVLIELGFAIRNFGFERIICVTNTNFGKIENLPFDINQNRIVRFNDDINLKLPIKTIIENFAEIEKLSRIYDYVEHDREIFKSFDAICPEELLNESITFAVDNLKTNQFYYDFWDKIIRFFEKYKNDFIDNELNNLSSLFSDSIDRFQSICATHFFQIMEHRWIYESDDTDFTDEEILRSHWYGFDYPYDKDYIDLLKKVTDSLSGQSQIIFESYKNFRLMIKTKLVI